MPPRAVEWVIAFFWIAAISSAASSVAQDVDPQLLGRSIVAVEFDSAAPIDVPGLLQLLPMRVGDRLDATAIAEARWRFSQTELFSSISIDPEPRDGGVALVVRFVRKPIVDRLRFQGNDALGERDLQRVVRLRESMPLSDELLEYSVQRLRERYVAEGFDAVGVHADVQPEVPGEVDVIFRIEEGEPLRVGAVAIDAGLPLSTDKIRDAAHVSLGERYQRDKQRAAEKAIVTLFREEGYYEVEVDSKWELGPAHRGTLRFHIDPGPLFHIAFDGNSHFSDAHLLGLMDLPRRPIVTDGTWRELARRAEDAYHADGYYFTRVSVVIAPGPPKDVRFTVVEGRAYRVAAVRFEGNHALSDAQLLAPMATRPPSWIPWRRGILLDDRLADDLKRLWYLYRKHGFESAEIVDARTEFDRDAGAVVITIVVEEGRQTVVRSVVSTGMEQLGGKVPSLTVTVGKPLNRENVDADRQTLLAALARIGYTRAKVKAEITTESNATTVAATVHYEALPGKCQFVGTIIVQDNFDTHASVIVRELPFEEGDPLDPSALLHGQRSIYRLGLFRSVTVRPLEEETAPPIEVEQLGQPRSAGEILRAQERVPPVIPAPVPAEAATPLPTVGTVPAPTASLPQRPPDRPPDRHPVAVTVAEKPPGNIQWGVGYNTRDGFRGFLEVSGDNLQGLARRLSLRSELNVEPGDFVPDEYLVNLGFREPRLAESPWTFRSNFIAQRSTRKVDQFSLERVALIPAVERYFAPGFQGGVDIQLEQAQVFDLEPDVQAFNPRDNGHLGAASLGPFMIYDARDDPFVPNRGIYDSVRLRVAPSGMADIPFVKLLGQHTQLIPLGDDLTVVYVARTGWALPFRGSDVLPIRERFFLGGRTTVRGFGENKIGPEGSEGHPLGGDLTLNLNTELRFPLLDGLGGVVFVDGGGVYFQQPGPNPTFGQSAHAISIHDFRRSTGPGLRYLTPVGPVSLDYGFKLDRRSGESVGEVHFSIGTIF